MSDTVTATTPSTPAADAAPKRTGRQKFREDGSLNLGPNVDTQVLHDIIKPRLLAIIVEHKTQDKPISPDSLATIYCERHKVRASSQTVRVWLEALDIRYTHYWDWSFPDGTVLAATGTEPEVRFDNE